MMTEFHVTAISVMIKSTITVINKKHPYKLCFQLTYSIIITDYILNKREMKGITVAEILKSFSPSVQKNKKQQ